MQIKPFKTMKELLKQCRSISVDTQSFIEKDFFDENYGFRHIPVLFSNAFKDWFVSNNNQLISIRKPSYFESWYDKHATADTPVMPLVNLKGEGLSEFRKNVWDLSSWHFLAEGEATWLFYSPATLEYLKLNNLLPDSSAEKGLTIDIEKLWTEHKVKPMIITQKAGELLFIPPFYGYSLELSEESQLFSKTILTEYNHDNLYAIFRKTEYKNSVKQLILEGFKNTKHLSVYETPAQRISNQVAA